MRSNPFKHCLMSGLLSGVSVFGLISCAEKKEPDDWAGPRIRLIRPQGAVLTDVLGAETSATASDEIRVLAASSPDDYSQPGDSSVSRVRITSTCHNPGKTPRKYIQESQPRPQFLIRDLISPEQFPFGAQNRDWEMNLACDFHFQFFNELGSSRSRLLKAVKVAFEPTAFNWAPTPEFALEAGRVSLTCVGQSWESEVSSGTLFSEVSTRLTEQALRDYQDHGGPSPVQYCLWVSKTANLMTKISTAQKFELTSNTSAIQIIANFNSNLPDVSTHLLNAFTFQIENQQTSVSTFRFPTLQANGNFIAFILSGAAGNLYRSYNRPTLATWTYQTSEGVLLWQKDNFTYVQIPPKGQLKIEVGFQLFHVCGSDSEFVGFDISMPTPGPFIIEQSLYPIVQGAEHEFFGGLTLAPIPTGATRNVSRGRLPFFTKWHGTRWKSVQPERLDLMVYDRCY